ncbi:MAG: TrbC/VirB2 family protein [Clostridia bacterium]|nr:TrbC/VirB2 family protein [Clostridia bacterium]
MKNMVKIISTVILIVMIISLSATVFALTPGDISGDADGVKGAEQITSIGKKVVGVFQIVGIVLSVIVLTVLGIKYMMGSAEEKADYKKSFIPYIVGAVLIFAASALAQVLYDFIIGATAS